jgi:hypothetical protein
VSRWLRHLSALCCLPLFAACASTARITGDFGEYRSYRQTRVATTLEEKLGASDRYLRQFPKGDYADEVRRWFAPAESRYFKLSLAKLSRLRAYLAVMPRGPHAEAAAERITELESVRVYAARREQRMLERAQAFEQRLAQAAEQRRAFLREFALLTRLLAATHTFRRPISELDPQLLLRQSASDCEGDHCLTVLSFTYAVPEDKVLIERVVDLALEVTLDHGRLKQLSLSAPELLTRVAEASRVSAVPADNPQARAEALGQSLDIVSDALAASLPGSECDAEAVSPVVLARGCHGLRLEVIAGTEAGTLDRVVVRTEKR